MNNYRPKTNNRFILYLILFIFFAPLFLAWGYHKTIYYWHVTTINNGVLLQPPLQFDQLKLTDKDNNTIDPHNFHGHWLMLYVARLPCEKACIANLYNMRQVRTALGKDRDRVERVVITHAMMPSFDQLLMDEYAGTQHLFTTNNKLAVQSGSIYLVDPLGNIMMRYPPNIAPKKLLSDLNRLLKVSKIG